LARTLAQKRQRPKRRGIAAQRRQVDKRSIGLSGSCVFREIFLLRQSGRIGLQVNDQAANADCKSSQWIFQRYNGGNSKKAKVVTDRKRMMLRTAGEAS
jgi:hypothetical protein